MPQENRKRGRGRRGQEKEKKENVIDELRARAEAEGEAPPAKRPRLSPPAHEASYLPRDQPDASFDDRGNESLQEAFDPPHHVAQEDDRPEAQFFGMLDESEQAYFKRADLMLENESFGSQEEKALFLDSVWNEARGKELKIACSQSCSRVLERLIKGSTSKQLKSAWSRMKGNFMALVQHRFASHCVEALFMAAAPAVSAELLDDGQSEQHGNENEFEDEDAQAVKQPIEEYYFDTIKELQDNLGFLITDSFASHAIRVLVLVLSGKPLAGSKSILQSKKKEKVYAAGKVDPAMLEARVVPDSFNKATSDLIRDSIQGLDTNYLRALATNQLANPVLQLFLEIEFAASGKQKAKDDKSLFRRLLPDDPPSEGTQSAAFVKGLLYDPVGSRLLETIVQHAPGKSFKTIYKVLFKDQLGSIVKNEVAGFVVSKILERLSQEELHSAAEQIVPQIPILFERERSSVIKCLIERCRVRGVDSASIAAAIAESFGQPGQSMLEKFLQPTSAAQENVSAERKAQLEQGNQVKMHASLLAQSMLSQQDAVQQLITDSLVACDGEFLTVLAKDRTATHVLQAALKPDTSDKNARRQLIQKLQPHVADLAMDNVGSHVVDGLNAAASGLHFLRERVAEELSRHQTEVKESFSGRQVWRNWMLDLYQRRRVDWIARVKEQFDDPPASGTANSLPDKFSSQGHPHRTGGGIEAARARFAAQNRQGGGMGKRTGKAPVAAT